MERNPTPFTINHISITPGNSLELFMQYQRLKLFRTRSPRNITHPISFLTLLLIEDIPPSRIPRRCFDQCRSCPHPRAPPSFPLLLFLKSSPFMIHHHLTHSLYYLPLPCSCVKVREFLQAVTLTVARFAAGSYQSLALVASFARTSHLPLAMCSTARIARSLRQQRWPSSFLLPFDRRWRRLA